MVATRAAEQTQLTAEPEIRLEFTKGVNRTEQAWETAFGWKRLREARRTLDRFRDDLPRGGRVLDLGCGRGYASRVLEEEFACEVFCCDVVNSAVHPADQYCIFDGQTIPFRTGSFDAVLVAFVLHHAHSPVDLLREARRVSVGPVLVVEDTPKRWADRMWGRVHTRSFSRRTGIDWSGRVRPDLEWRHVFQRAGLSVRLAKPLSRWERLPPVSRTAFVLETTS
ncbi:MAG: class I SAM-dependent methyltransferase [Gemmatimonadota bacterium]